VTKNSENARTIILDADARLQAAGSDRTKVKLEIYNELRSKGLDEEAELLMTFDAVTRANSNQFSQTNFVSTTLLSSRHPKWLLFRTKRISMITALVSAMLIVIGVWGAPFAWIFLVNRGSPVVVPESHFVGEHGKNKKLIIFVHGVMGDMDNTWVNSVTHQSWPDMIRHDDRLDHFDVFVYGYASPMLGNASTIQEISVRFLQYLKDAKFFQNYSEIEFITHSMGGIITKRTLDMLNNPAEISLLQKVHTVIYISVPSNGANIAAVQSWLSQNPQFKGMDPKAGSDFLKSVESDWANMLRQRTVNSPFPRTYSAYETVPTGTIMVVPELYTSELSDDRIIGFDYNHIDIVKPKDSNAEVYVWVKARLLAPLAVSQNTESQATQLPGKRSSSSKLQSNKHRMAIIQQESHKPSK
jgi:Putative serine esterase (DUF676)